MRGHRFHAIVVLMALFACASIAAGCGDDDETTTTSSTTTSSAGDGAQTIDAAVQSCSEEAQQLGGAAGTALGSACTSVGDTAKQAASETGKKAEKALSQAASTCKSTVGQLPSGQAQDALTKLCDAIASAE